MKKPNTNFHEMSTFIGLQKWIYQNIFFFSDSLLAKTDKVDYNFMIMSVETPGVSTTWTRDRIFDEWRYNVNVDFISTQTKQR